MATYKYNPLLPKRLEEQQEAIGVTANDVVTSEAINYVLLPGNSFGNLTGSGTIPPGTNLQALLESALEGYLSPTFATFTLSGLSTNQLLATSTLEVGTQLGGNRTATWTTTNPSNIIPDSVDIFDPPIALAVDIANDGTEVVVVPSNLLTIAGRIFVINAAPTQGSAFGRTFTVLGSYKRYFGSVSSVPTSSADIKAIPTTVFDNTSTSFTLNTGNVNKIFVIGIPFPRTLSSVIDQDSANANVTSEYVLSGTLTEVTDATNSTLVTYNIYINTVAAVPYSTNHRHQITII